jgi:Predicted membrane protein (DUF2142)
MTAAAANLPIVPSPESKIVLLLCCIAAVRVFVFSAAFPLFNVLDEQDHFDLVARYSSGDIPRAIEPTCVEARHYIIFYETYEYLWPPTRFPNGEIPPPLWSLPLDKANTRIAASQSWWDKEKNYEDSQPPLYYILAGLWWQLGKACGLHNVSLLYSIRFLNILFVTALVWTGFIATRLIFPGKLFLQLSVPALLAFFPQTSFYTVSNDILSPLCFGVAFIFLVKIMRAEILSLRLGIFAGLALAATFLTKFSNLPLLTVSAAAILFKIAQLAKSGKFRAAFPSLAALTFCAVLPISAWLAWCKHSFGDITGNEQKIQSLGWTHKPFAEWWHHPIFTLQGLRTFLSDLIASFWQGEMLWHHRPLALPSADLVYVMASVILLVVALLNLLPHSKTTTATQRQALWFGLWCFVAAVAFLGFFSIIYDFHDCFYPSREYPYFASGRLMLGALIPFLLLFVYGLDCTLKKFGDATKFSVLAMILLFMLATEITIDWQIFQNPYNWFHM